MPLSPYTISPLLPSTPFCATYRHCDSTGRWRCLAVEMCDSLVITYLQISLSSSHLLHAWHFPVVMPPLFNTCHTHTTRADSVCSCSMFRILHHIPAPFPTEEASLYTTRLPLRNLHVPSPWGPTLLCWLVVVIVA